MRYQHSVIASALVFAAGAFPQNSTTTSSYGASMSFPAAFATNAPSGAPYSAEEVDEENQTLADGTSITHKSVPVKVYRDSQGRTRRERELGAAMLTNRRMPNAPVIVQITDPVAQVKYTLDPANKVAHRQQIVSRRPMANGIASSLPRRVVGSVGGSTSGVAAVPAAGNGVAPPPTAPTLLAAPSHPEVSTEKLGTESIEGVLAVGTRRTVISPAGSDGNDRPITTVTEQWLSPDLNLVILSKSTDPRRGERIHKLVNISRAEPSPDLFQPPADYTVIDEAGGFSIQWGSHP